MKAAYGSPPSGCNRHHSSSSYERVKSIGSKSPRKMLMPPILRLNSIGEVASSDSSVNSDCVEVEGHQRTNIYQEAPVSATNRLLGKLMCHLAPQSSSSKFLPVSQMKGLSALDELVACQQTPEIMSKSVNRSPVKMAQPITPKPDRYGQWGAKCPTNVHVLPPGVFPCHVFRDLQRLERQQNHVQSTSGQFVYEVRAPLRESFLRAWSKCSLGNFSVCQNQKNTTETPASSSRGKTSKGCVDVPKSPVTNQSVKTSTVCMMDSTETRGTQRETILPAEIGLDIIGVGTNSDKVKLAVQQDCKEPEKKCIEKETLTREFLHNTGTRGSLCCSDTSKTSLGEKELGQTNQISTQSSPLKIACENQEETSSSVSQNCKKSSQKEDIESKESRGAECLEILLDRTNEWKCFSQDKYDSEDEVDWEDESDDDDSPEDAEQSQIWNGFMAQQCTVLTLITGSLFLGKVKQEEREEPEEKTVIPKPCPAANKKWNEQYPSLPPADRECKVWFKCGEDEDTVHEYEKGEEETLTVMEIQKSRDLTRKNRGNAGKLLRKSCEADGVLETISDENSQPQLGNVCSTSQNQDEENLEFANDSDILSQGDDINDDQNASIDSDPNTSVSSDVVHELQQDECVSDDDDEASDESGDEEDDDEEDLSDDDIVFE